MGKYCVYGGSVAELGSVLHPGCDRLSWYQSESKHKLLYKQHTTNTTTQIPQLQQHHHIQNKLNLFQKQTKRIVYYISLKKHRQCNG